MKITGFLQARNEIKSGHLERYLKWNIDLLDHLVALDDGSDDFTFDALSVHADLCLRNEHSSFLNELGSKAKLLKIAKQKLPETDWFLWLDADEVLYMDRSELESIILSAEKQECDAVDFALTNLWRSEGFYRIDSKFNDLRKVILWRNKPDLAFKPKFGLHHVLHPSGIEKIYIQNEFKVLHFGFSSPELILQKFIYGNRLLQRGEYFWRLLNENKLELRSIKEQLPYLGSRYPRDLQINTKAIPIAHTFYDWYAQAKKAGFKYLDRSNSPDLQFSLPTVNNIYSTTTSLVELIDLMRGNDPGNFGIIATEDVSINKKLLSLGFPIIHEPIATKEIYKLVGKLKFLKVLRIQLLSKIQGVLFDVVNSPYTQEMDILKELYLPNSKPLIKIENKIECGGAEAYSRLVLRRATIYPFLPIVFYKECAEIHISKFLVPRHPTNQVYFFFQFQSNEFAEVIQSELFQSFCAINQKFSYYNLLRRIAPNWLKSISRLLQSFASSFLRK
jgi:hypothetical protein